jgi:hypothetical protein
VKRYNCVSDWSIGTNRRSGGGAFGKRCGLVDTRIRKSPEDDATIVYFYFIRKVALSNHKHLVILPAMPPPQWRKSKPCFVELKTTIENGANQSASAATTLVRLATV